MSRFGEGLPDFRNLGTILRLLLIAEGANLLAWFAQSGGRLDGVLAAPAPNLLFEFSLLMVVIALYGAGPWLTRLPYPMGVASVVVIATAIAAGVDAGVGIGFPAAPTPGPFKAGLIGGILAALILIYFDWRRRVLAPSLVESRLIALQARIRPHFLFNCLNTAIAVLREQPQLAEKALLDLSDLFRAALAEQGQLARLEDEIKLAKGYLEIEQLRLGDRLRVNWTCAPATLDALVPAMLLQPLLENAVHHGVERCESGGDIDIDIRVRERWLSIEIRNPMPPVGGMGGTSAGNRIALRNIAERLSLLFDAEAEMSTQEESGRYCVTIRLPMKSLAKSSG